MRSQTGLFSLALSGLTALFLVGTVFLTAPEARAESASLNTGRVSCTPICRKSPASLAKAPRIDSDRAAALESLQYALSHVGDGGSYVWQRSKSKLSGVVQPTRSFRNAKGRICRYLYVLVSQGERSSKTEGVACRLADGRWSLEG